MDIRSRIAGLDGLRAIAVLAVIQQHFGSGVYLRILGAGSFAVRLFFVLSGFLITRILLAAREAPDLLSAWRAFVVRRTLRIFPAYYLILGIMVLCTPSLRQHWGWYTLYATNLYIGLRDAWPEVGGHLWSLAVEEQFYLLWPAVILFLPERWLPRVMLGLVFAAPVTRYVTFAATHKGLLAVLTLPGSVDTLSIGAWLAWRWRLGAPPTSDGVGLIGVISYVTLQAVAALAENPLLPIVLSNTTAAFAGLWIVDHVAREGLGTRWLRFRPLAFVGMISYSVYLIHDFLPALLVFAFPSSPVWFAAGGFAQWMIIAGLSIAWAAASWFLLERPLNSLKHRVSL